MKLTSVLAGAFVAAATVSAIPSAAPMAAAAPAADASADPWFWRKFCHLPGQGCRKVRRAAAAADEILAAGGSDIYHPNQFEHYPDAGAKAKRSAEAFAAAAANANAHAHAHPDASADPWFWRKFCHLPGQGCRKVRRAAAEIHEELKGEDNEWANQLREAANAAVAEL